MLSAEYTESLMVLVCMGTNCSDQDLASGHWVDHSLNVYF